MAGSGVFVSCLGQLVGSFKVGWTHWRPAPQTLDQGVPEVRRPLCAAASTEGLQRDSSLGAGVSLSQIRKEGPVVLTLERGHPACPLPLLDACE